jgi:hypothetical protein
MAATDDRDQRELRFHRLYQANYLSILWGARTVPFP